MYLRLVVVLIFSLCTSGLLTGQEVEPSTGQLAKRFAASVSPYLSTDLKLQYKSQSNSFGHLQRPWATSQRKLSGTFAVTPKSLLLQELISRGLATTETKSAYSTQTLYRCTGDDQAIDVDTDDHLAFLRRSCRYTPAVLLRHTIEFRKACKFEVVGKMLVVSSSHGDEQYEVHFDDTRLSKIVWQTSHAMWGDQTIEIKYSKEKKFSKWVVPTAIMETTFGTTVFQTEVLGEATGELAIEIPEEHHLQAVEKPAVQEIEVERFSDSVTFLMLPQCDSRSVLVEFSDFLMVIDAPVSSSNGKLILEKVAELIPNKPVKYFAFGHHHPHYLAGVRPFIAAGATILTTKKVAPYVRQVAEFSHSRKPDELEAVPRKLELKIFDGQTKITGGDYAVEIFDIGTASKHTDDYLLFHFPKERMVFQDDGVWIRANSPVRARTKAIYTAIKKLGLDVDDCIQSWPTQNFGVATKVKFRDLQEAVVVPDED